MSFPGGAADAVEYGYIDQLADDYTRALLERSPLLATELGVPGSEHLLDDLSPAGAASQADLAVDLRQQIRLKLQQGQSREQIVDFMTQRYGDFVLYKPPLKASTWLLWGGPFVLLGIALIALAVNIRRRRSSAAPLQADESERLRRLLDQDKS